MLNLGIIRKVDGRGLNSIKTEEGYKGSHLTSASTVRGRVFGFQTLFETAKQNPVALVLLVLSGMKLPLVLEAPVHHEGRTQNRELVSGHMEFAALVEDGRTGKCRHGGRK